MMREYYPTPVIDDLKLKAKDSTILGFLSRKSVKSPKRIVNIKRFNCKIKICQFDYLSSIRTLATDTGYSKKTIEKSIKKLVDAGLIKTQTVLWKKRQMGTIYSLAFIQTPKNTLKKGTLKPYQIYIKNYKTNKLKIDSNLGIFVHNCYNKGKSVKPMNEVPKKEIIEIPKSPKRGHHTKENIKNNSHSSSYKKLVFECETLKNLFSEIIDDYGQLNPERIKIQNEKKRILSNPHFSAFGLCALRGYMLAQMKKDNDPRYLKNFPYALDDFPRPTAVQLGYEFYIKKLGIVIVNEAEQAQKQKEAEQDAIAETLHAKTRKYWDDLLVSEPSEASRIADKAKIYLNKGTTAFASTICPSLLKKDSLSKFQFAAIEIELQRDARHMALITQDAEVVEAVS
tara:strand:- start:12074 stop:13267 length:1194 start_codon:yes stop_codon:yes gene_type:complete